jgi:hypothetical protein
VLRVAAVLLVVMLASSSAARDVSVPPAQGDDMRLKEAPVDFPEAADLVEVASGLVFPVLEDGKPSQKATKVPHGVFITAQGYANIEKSVARELEALKAENAELKARLALQQSAPGVPLKEPASSTPNVSTGAKVTAAVVLFVAGGLVGCRVAGGCK